MAVIAGIDEAGYGPVLGPLVCAATAFSVPNDCIDKSLWDVLSGSVSSKPSRRTSRLAVADSKKLFNGPADLARLERTALAFSTLLSPQNLADIPGFMQISSAECPLKTHEYPWYNGQVTQLPVAADRADIATCANALRLDAERNGVKFLAGRSQVLLAGEFNELLAKTRNKSILMFDLAARHIAQLLGNYADDGLVIYADKQGGRDRYRALLQRTFPDWQLQIIKESNQLSSYRMHNGRTQWQIHFQAKAESQHLPVALASIYAKYVRELFMRMFNAYWCGQVPGLKPTAGYYTDGRRFLNDIAAHCQRLHTPMHKLVRSK